MPPGPVSDSYDPEFSTGENARAVQAAIQAVVTKLESGVLKGKPLANILEVIHGRAGRMHAGPLSEREWRIIRFCLNRAIETI
jgi:hypothetical protein